MKESPPERGREILTQARLCWDSWSEFRSRRNRCKRYTYGRQWDDPVEVRGRKMTEEQFIQSEGHIPLKNNLIRRMVRNVLGTYLNYRDTLINSTAKLNDDMSVSDLELHDLLAESRERNQMTDFTVRSLEEFLISGMVVWRKGFMTRKGISDITTDLVSPENFFIDVNSSDPRGSDVEFLGEIHDITFPRLCSSLASSPAQYRRLERLYSPPDTPDIEVPTGEHDLSSFSNPSRPGLCRVIEVWCKERRPRYRCHDTKDGTVFRIEEKDHKEIVESENRRRLAEGRAAGAADSDIPLIRSQWIIDETWRFYFLTPEGHILSEGDSPYRHGRHPYVFKAYPFVDGEIHSFVADVIDQQRHINRLITIFDWVMRASAKGVLLFPEESLPLGWTMRDICDEWSRHNGVIPIKTSNDAPMPQQMSTNNINVGIMELLNIQMQMFEDISGVTGALQGKLANGNVSGTLYDQQTRNALTSLIDLLESFRTFEREAERIDLSLLKQYLWAE